MRIGDIEGLPTTGYRSRARGGGRRAEFGVLLSFGSNGGTLEAMSRGLRALALFLAMLPAIWGNCLCRMAGACCCASMEASEAEAPCCPLCHERDEKSRPSAPCSHCPCTMARDGSAPAPAAVEAPTADLTVLTPVNLSDAGPVVRSLESTAPSDIRPPGGPPDLVGIVVLLV